MTTTIVRTNQFVPDLTGSGNIVFTTASSLGAGGAPAIGNKVVVVIESGNSAISGAPSDWTLDRSITTTSNAKLYWYSRTIDGTEAATYTWTGAGSGHSAVAAELHSSNGSGWVTDTGASDPGTGSSVSSRLIGTSNPLGSAESAVVAATALTGGSRSAYTVSGGPTFTEINAATKFDHYATAVTASASALTLTASWSGGGSSVGCQGFQTYYVPPLTTVTPSAVPMTLTEPAPTITADSSSPAAAVPMVMAYPAPVPVADGSASPSAVPLVLTLPAPDILSGVPVPADALAMSLLLPTPGFVIDETASPGAVPMALAFPAPSILITVPVFPQPVPLAFAFPHPDVESRFGPVPVFALGRAPSTTPADRYPEPPYDPDRAAPPVQYRDGAVTYDPSP